MVLIRTLFNEYEEKGTMTLNKDTNGISNSNNISIENLQGRDYQVHINHNDPEYLREIIRAHQRESQMEKDLLKKTTESELYLFQVYIQSLTSEVEELRQKLSQREKQILELMLRKK